ITGRAPRGVIGDRAAYPLAVGYGKRIGLLAVAIIQPLIIIGRDRPIVLKPVASPLLVLLLVLRRGLLLGLLLLVWRIILRRDAQHAETGQQSRSRQYRGQDTTYIHRSYLLFPGVTPTTSCRRKKTRGYGSRRKKSTSLFRRTSYRKVYTLRARKATFL